MLGRLHGAVARFRAADGFFLAAGLAFIFLVCMIPLVLLGVSTVGFVLSGEQAADEVIGQLARNFPVYRGEISRALHRIVETRRTSGILGTLILVAFSTPLFTASRLVLHRLQGGRPAGRFLPNLLVDAGMVLLLGVFLFALTLVTWTYQWFEDFVLYPARVAPEWIALAALGLSVGLSTVMFYVGYRYVPRRRIRMGAALTAAIVAALLWEVAKQLFRLYIRRVGLYDQVYGPLAVLAGLAMFVYYSAVVFVFGGAVAAAGDARR